jgi:hypothetical protein
MRRDIDGDLWYYADIDPPIHLRAKYTGILILWFNYKTNVVWHLREKGTPHSWIDNADNDHDPLFKKETAIRQDLLEITGHV